jgi:hypothetical protein
MIKLQPLAMRVPTNNCVYTISRFVKSKKVSEQEFVERYTDYSVSMLVSFDEDGYSNPKRVTAYGRGFDGWWIAEYLGGAE